MARRTIAFRWTIVLASALVASALLSETLYAQAGLRASLELLDKDGDGDIEPEEITPLARPYLERVAAARRMSLERDNSIERWQEAARVYYALQNGVAGKSIRPKADPAVMGFGPDPDQPIVPEFGLAEVKYPYTQEDLYEADRTLRRSDRNDDGFIDRAEARRAEWTHLDPFEMDYDRDGRLSRLELGQRYARRRLLEGASDELVQKARRTGNGIRSSDSDDRRRSDESQYWRRGGTRYYLTATVLSRFDLNKNGRLDPQEAAPLGIPSGRIDVDRDGELSRDELYEFFGELQDEVGGLAEPLPGWFYELDANRDQQVAMSEFATEWTDEKLNEFTALDSNNDGLLTATEVLQAKSMVGGSYQNDEAVILPPHQTVISEIEVDEDYVVGDLNVQLSITHTYASHLDAYLTGPDGQRIELFTEVGGSDDHFDRTVLDDQAQYPIVKARPPFKGSFMPEALVKRQPSLSHFNGKSINGVWQLVIRCSRSDRFGMLHRWSLIVTPKDEMMDPPATAPESEGTQPPTSLTSNSTFRPSELPDRSAGSMLPVQLKRPSSNSGGRFELGEPDDQERAKAEARKKAFERYKAYMDKLKQEGKEMPAEKRSYFEKFRKGDSFEK